MLFNWPLKWLTKFFTARQKGDHTASATGIAVICADVDYSAHALVSHWQSEEEFAVVAFLDDEPWSHRTWMLGAQLYYPSEVTALVKKHDVKALVYFEQGKQLLTVSELDGLAKEGVRVVPLPSPSGNGGVSGEDLAAQFLAAYQGASPH